MLLCVHILIAIQVCLATGSLAVVVFSDRLSNSWRTESSLPGAQFNLRLLECAQTSPPFSSGMWNSPLVTHFGQIHVSVVQVRRFRGHEKNTFLSGEINIFHSAPFMVLWWANSDAFSDCCYSLCPGWLHNSCIFMVEQWPLLETNNNKICLGSSSFFL